MKLLLERKRIRRRGGDGNAAIEARIEEDTMRPAGIERKQALMTLMALFVISPFAAAAQKPTAPANSTTATSKSSSGQFPKNWHSESTKHDFRVDVTNDRFHAEWVNIPPAAAKQGAYIRTDCRRAGAKWVGSSSVNMLFAIPGAPTGKDTKMCALTVRFEVDSLSAEKITGHSESIRSFDVNACRAEQTKWAEFTWIPKK
jgi:hypothetical protein